MKISRHKLIMPVLTAGILMGCSSPRGTLTATPSPCVVTPEDGMASLDIDFNIPDHYLSRRSRLFITPTLVVGDSVVDEFQPLVVDAPIYRKKIQRKEVLEDYVDPYAGNVVAAGKGAYTLHYNDSIEVTEEVNGGRILAVVSNDGCGQCSGIDTLEVATISYPPIVIDTRNLMQNAWVEPEFVAREKVHNGKGEAHLQFVVDKWDIVMDLANNRAELTEMLNTLRPILSDSLTTVTSLNISGSASAEASYRHNVMLANNRVNAAKKWLSSELNLPRSVRDIIKVVVAPEGWEPVVQAMIAAGDPDSIKVRELMVKYPGTNDDAAEPYIRRLACWPRIKANYLAKDRKVSYKYSWTVKSFTNDQEMLDIYTSRPDALIEDEFLHVASLAKNDDSQKQVYEKLLTYFPDSTPAISNLAYLYEKEGDHDAVITLLTPIEGKTPEMLMILAASYINKDNDEKAIELLEGVGTSEAIETLNLLKKKQRRRK